MTLRETLSGARTQARGASRRPSKRGGGVAKLNPSFPELVRPILCVSSYLSLSFIHFPVLCHFCHIRRVLLFPFSSVPPVWGEGQVDQRNESSVSPGLRDAPCHRLNALKKGGQEPLLSGSLRTQSSRYKEFINMGAFLDKPKMEKHNAHGQGNELRYGLSSMQGWRVEMEDAHTAVIGLPNGLDAWSFFAVYDGHAGSQVAKYCCEHLLDHITSNQDFKGTDGHLSVWSVKNGIRTGFLQIDEHMRVISEKKHGADRSGSTAVGVMLSPTHIYFINCGDSRGLLCRNKKVHFFTQDHKPSNPLEKERIQNAGGSVMIQRVNGSLAVSRALGDFDYKCVHGKGPTEQLVSPEPEVYEIERSEEDDQFIILACDGIWDVMGNEELCDFVWSRLEVTDDLERVCNEIVDTCLYKGSRDNMSVVLICFPSAPKVLPEAVKREAELDKYLEGRVEGGSFNQNK